MFKEIDIAMGSPKFSISNKEAMILFVNDHNSHLNKEEKVSAAVSIDTTKNSEVIIPNKKYQHFVGGAHPNHYIPFTEDVSDGAKKRKKLE